MPSFQALVDFGKQFYERGWMQGTAGNLSVKLKSQPLEIIITPSGVNKGHLSMTDLITVGEPASGSKNDKPSAETVIHQAIYRAVPEATSVLHVHPIYSTLISGLYGHAKEIRRQPLEWVEMLKGIGVPETDNAELTILPNWQDVHLVARDLAEVLKHSKKPLPAVLIYNHGLTAWGKTPEEARNHLEIVEYVCQLIYFKNLALPSPGLRPPSP